MTGLPAIRRAAVGDRSTSIDTAARAFSADPFIRHLMPDDERYLDDASRFFGLLFDTRLAGGELWCTDDCAAVAQWNPPGGNRMGGDWVDAQWDAIEPELHPATIPGVERLDHALTPTWPDEPHWYLGVLATHPDRQGGGLGSAVLMPGLAEADAAGLASYLVTATEANVAFYAPRFRDPRRGGPAGRAAHLDARTARGR